MRALLKKNKRGSLDTIVPAILVLVITSAILVFGLVILQELRDTQTSGSISYDTANDTIVGLGTFSDFWEIIVLAVVVSVVIGLLLTVFAGGSQRVE